MASLGYSPLWFIYIHRSIYDITLNSVIWIVDHFASCLTHFLFLNVFYILVIYNPVHMTVLVIIPFSVKLICFVLLIFSKNNM